MKYRRPVAFAISTRPCQRPGCLYFGRLRIQTRHHASRGLYLCDQCLEWLLPIHLNDLFLKFGTALE